jgi:malate dehydrogenase (oxaloacetate-decarboxylating)
MTGVGAAGIACADILLGAGVRDLIGCDKQGALYRGREGLDPVRAAFAEKSDPHDLRGTANELLRGADVFIGLSGPGAVSAEAIRTMAPDAVVFAMANPVPEVQPEEIWEDAAVIATGRSDYPNQINNVLAFPGIFRGALDVRARTINEEMKLAAGRAIASVVPDDQLDAENIIPSVFNREVAPAVAAAVAEAARATGVARRGESTTEAAQVYQ